MKILISMLQLDFIHKLWDKIFNKFLEFQQTLTG